MHELGIGVTDDNTVALEWYTKAADQGHSRAQYNLGSLLKNNYAYRNISPLRKPGKRSWLGIRSKPKQELGEWVPLLHESANQGDSDAMLSLGIVYYFGLGVHANSKSAFTHYFAAAELNNLEAMGRVASMLLEEEGFPICDPLQAVMWLKRAANQGERSEMGTLAGCYARGEGVERDLKLAGMWWILSLDEYGGQLKTERLETFMNNIGITRQDYDSAMHLEREWRRNNSDADNYRHPTSLKHRFAWG